MTKATKPASLEPAAVLRAATRAVDCISASWKLSLQEADRDEVIAEAVGKAWRHRSAYNPRKASLPTWVSRIARNTLLDYLRRRRTAPSAEPLSDSGLELRPDGPDTLLIDKEEVEAILGEASERSVSDASDESYIIVTTQLLYRDGEFFGFPVIGASFLFGERNYGGYMQSILCQYDMEAVGDISALIDALTMLYGEPDSEEDQYELIRWNREGDSQEVIHSWTLPDKSLIVLYDIVKDGSHQCSVECTNIKGLTRASFLQLWDRPDP